jgi:hypothetical protein
LFGRIASNAVRCFQTTSGTLDAGCAMRKTPDAGAFRGEDLTFRQKILRRAVWNGFRSSPPRIEGVD